MGRLSGRAIHLQHALGLGPMWVTRASRILPASSAPATPTELIAAPATQSLVNTAVPTTDSVPPTAAPPQQRQSPAVDKLNPPPHTVSKRAASMLAHIAAVQQGRPQPDKASVINPNASAVLLDTSQDDIASLHSKVLACHACELSQERRQAFAAHHITRCRLIVVLPHPSLQDDAAGVLLSGEAGQMWQNIMHAIKLSADEVYLTNAIKCAPNTTILPKQHHAACCSVYLQRELQLLPAVPVLLLAENQHSLWQRLQQWVGAERVYRIAHPNKMRRNPAAKRSAWNTLQQLMLKL